MLKEKPVMCDVFFWKIIHIYQAFSNGEDFLPSKKIGGFDYISITNITTI